MLLCLNPPSGGLQGTNQSLKSADLDLWLIGLEKEKAEQKVRNTALAIVKSKFYLFTTIRFVPCIISFAS